MVEESTTNEVKKKRRRGSKARLLEEEQKLKKSDDIHIVQKKEKVTSDDRSDIKPDEAGKNNAQDSSRKILEPRKGDGQNSKKRKRNKNKKKTPQKGEVGFMTPTQLRNARKRRKKKADKESSLQLQSEAEQQTKTIESDNLMIPESKATPSLVNKSLQKGQDGQKKKKKVDMSRLDPSLKYINNPKSTPIIHRAKEYFQTSHNKEFPIILGTSKHWRAVSKLAVRYSSTQDTKQDKKVVIGLFAPKSHTILSVSKNEAHHPSINSAILSLEKIVENTEGVVPYDEKTGLGNLRFVQIQVEQSTLKSQVTLIWKSNQAEKEVEKEILKKFTDSIIKIGTKNNGKKKKKEKRQSDFNLHSLFVHQNNSWKHSNAIFDISKNASWENLYGPDTVEESLSLSNNKESESYYPPPYSVSLQFSPNVFRQANLNAFTNIVISIRKRIIQFNATRNNNGEDSSSLPSLLELYGGVGTIGLHLVDLISRYRCSDENPHNPPCFHKALESIQMDSLLSSPSHLKEKCQYVPKNAEDMMRDRSISSSKSRNSPDIIIVDPPRKGLEDSVVHKLLDLAGQTTDKLLVYVSCGFDAFQRNCDSLCEKWQLEHVEGHVLFPGSDAIETLAFFVPKSS